MRHLREVSANRGWPDWRTPAGDAPATIRVGSADSRGFRISYEDAGAGRPILLVPGHTMMAADWREMGYTQRLAMSRRVITLDPLGHGLSDKPHDAEAYRWPGVVEDLVAVMDAAGVERAPIWGYSRGATLAAGVAIQVPERVSALILGGEDLLSVPPTQWTADNWAARLTRGEWAALYEVYGGSAKDHAFAEATLDASALGAAILGRRLSGAAGLIDPSRISCPTLIYAGGEDDAQAITRTAEALGVTAHILDGLDHRRGFSASDRVLPLVTDFLDQLAD
jgi:pimeloyl-ACP methyl ester carboxylesterase